MSTRRMGQLRAILFLLLVLAFLSPWMASADPTGATLNSAVTEYAQNKTPGSRSDDRGTITTMVLSAIQQNQHWKAYVGNVSGSLTLDDATNQTIYDWTLTTITGNVFASRFNNISWTNITCAPLSLINTESFFHNMTLGDSDRINATFNYTIHEQFDVATSTLSANTCNSTATYLNGTRQNISAASLFQELLVRDGNNQFVYLTGIENDVAGFDNQPYDFQMIVAESNVKASPTAHYFYVELR